MLTISVIHEPGTTDYRGLHVRIGEDTFSYTTGRFSKDVLWAAHTATELNPCTPAEFARALHEAMEKN